MSRKKREASRRTPKETTKSGDGDGLTAKSGSDDAGGSESGHDQEFEATVTFGRSHAIRRTVAGADVPLPPDDGRYRLGAFLGAGGMGEVFEAEDCVLGRTVALKFDRSGPETHGEFAREAKLQADLDHPNIPPVHDLRVDGEGRPFYAMRLIRGRSLQQILNERSSDESRWSLARLLGLFQQACLALDFAHAKGVVHLDLKPANIMVGEFGELYVVDWGLSGRVEDGEGSIGGTPAYMSPEQSRGEFELGPASDVFSLGVVLYEIVMGRLPFTGKTQSERWARMREGDFDRGDVWRGQPVELREIIERALSPRSSERFDSARALHDEVQLFLEGTKERERKLLEARAALDRGEAELGAVRSLAEQADQIEAGLRDREPDSWRPVEDKREYWDLEDRLRSLRSESELALERATGHFAEAHGLAPDDEAVSRRYAEHLWRRYRVAEDEQDRFQTRYFEAELRRLALPEYDRALRGDGALEIRVVPPADRIRLYRVDEVDRRWVPTDEVHAADGPLIVDPIPMGTYHVVIDRAGFRSIAAPVSIGREARVELDWRLRTDVEIGLDFVQVPAGPFVMGGDSDTFLSVERQVRDVEEFFIARFPVTWEEYAEFLTVLAVEAPVDCQRFLPTLVTNGEANWKLDEATREVTWWFDSSAREDRRRWPIFSVDYFAAEAYCAWRSSRDGRQYRLPRDDEWEKAARGVDGRRFPWGSRYDASFCQNSGSTEHKAQPGPVGQFVGDESPYGVRDLAGGVREWCSGWVNEKDQQRLVRGGSWNFGPIGAHCAYRMGCSPALAYPFIGFRVATGPSDPPAT